MKTMKKIMIAMVGLSLLLAVLIPQKSLATKAAQNGSFAVTLGPEVNIGPDAGNCGTANQPEYNPSVVKFPDGEIVVASTYGAQIAINYNGGHSFVDPRHIYSQFLRVRHAHLARRESDLYLLTTAVSLQGDAVLLYRSKDRGRSFSLLQRFMDVNGPSSFYSSIVSDSEGIVHILYSKYVNLMTYVRSGDGETFQTQELTQQFYKNRNTPLFITRPTLFVAGNSVYVFWAEVMRLGDCKSGADQIINIYSARSSDHGISFGAPEPVALGVQLSVCRIGFREQIRASFPLSVAFDEVSKAIYVAYVVRGGDGSRDVYITRKIEGKDDAWVSVRVDNAPYGRNSFMPSVTTSNGVVLVMFLDDRDGQDQYNLYGAMLANNATNWKVFRVASAWNFNLYKAINTDPGDFLAVMGTKEGFWVSWTVLNSCGRDLYSRLVLIQ